MKLFSSPQTTSTGLANLILAGWLFYQGHQTEASVALLAGLQGIFARDNGVTSKQAGAE